MSGPKLRSLKRAQGRTGVDMANGDAEIGDEVVTLNLKRAVTGKVIAIDRWKRNFWASVSGVHYPGGPLVGVKSNVDDLKIIRKDLSRFWKG